VGVLWETTEGGMHYSVRSAGDSVRLYTNGVFHTQWNPSRPFDPIHINIAKQWFGVAKTNSNVHHADAIRWIKSYSGKQYDIIIDDLFGHEEGEPLRAQALTQTWIRTLSSSLSPAGLLIVNCVSRAELTTALPSFAKQGFNYAYRWSLPEYDNVIGVFSRELITARQWTAHLDKTDLSPAMKLAAKWVIRRPLK